MGLERSVVIASGSRESARQDALIAGLDPVIMLTKSECAGALGSVRRRADELGIHTLAIHTADWSRQPMAQFYELAAVRLGLPDCRIIAPGGATQLRMSQKEVAARVAALPFEVAGGLGVFAAEAARCARTMRNGSRARRALNGAGDGVIAIWMGAGPGTAVGGSVTHVSGVLSGFRNNGQRVTLVTLYEPPPQMAAAIDELVCVPPMPRWARVTGEITAISANRWARAAAQAELSKLRPSFVYQRYDAYVTCGVEVADRAGVPVVLEWNNSAVWARNHWHGTHRFKRLFTPLLEHEERYLARRADLLAAVSDHAAKMALDAGAAAERVVTVPNAVDIAAIDAGIALASSANDGSLIGWVGSFGDWHGAEIMVEAVALLPDRIRAVMIGDGVRRDGCEELARRLGVWERIEWTGSVPHIEAIRRLAECDLLVSPHVPLPGGQPFFGSPTKLFEYMAIGRPIVASRLEQLGEVLEDGETARLVPPGDARALAATIEQVLGEPDHGMHLGIAARARAEREHTWDQRARTILDRLSA